MTVRVDLRDWGRKNLRYIVPWCLMGTITFVLLVWKLRLDTLILIAPFIPYLIIVLGRMYQELRR